MPTDFSRMGLTDTVLLLISTATTKPVGDGILPEGGSWQGQPQASGANFVPYNVVQTSTATRSSGPFDDSQADWQVPYIVWSFGVRRNQCEAMADLARNSLSGMNQQTYTLGSGDYKVQQVRSETIGSITRYDQTDPPYWGQMDTITIWITKE